MQVVGRLVHNPLRRNTGLPRLSRREANGNWASPILKRATFSNAGDPSFLNRSGKLEKASDWQAAGFSRLWLYNLHYFDDLSATGAPDRLEIHRELVRRWVEENLPFQGTGWEPYPCSLRIVNWIKWVLAGNELEPGWRDSLGLQAEWLSRNIEWHLLGNHLFANAKALVFAGLFFKGTRAQKWLAKGLRILAKEMPEQVLPDGGQFELSPMYHAIALEDVLDLVNAAQAWPGRVPDNQVDEWRAASGRMLAWASLMKHPDGRIALFNDSAFGIAADFSELAAYAKRLGIEWESPKAPLCHLGNSGYVRAESGNTVLFADVGRIGPDYLPGHAHADTLGFELSLFGKRWFVDTGCSTYDVSAERLRQRGTAAHNTVTVDGQDSSEVWSSFRVARRARPFDVSVADDNGDITISASHDGYRRLPGRVTHRRSFRLTNTLLRIEDSLEGRFETACANFLLHPDVGAQLSGNSISLKCGDNRAVLEVEPGSPQLEPATWHPEFGLSVPTLRVRVPFERPELTTTITWDRTG